MESQNSIIQNFIEQNSSKIQFSDGKFYSTYIPHTNPIESLSSFAKSRGIKDAKNLKEDLINILDSKHVSPKVKDIAKTIEQQIAQRFQTQEMQLIKAQKQAEEEKTRKENREKVQGEINKQKKEKIEELAIREETRKNKEQRDEKKPAIRDRMVNIGLETDKHLHGIIDELLREPEILETLMDKESADKIRKNAIYSTVQGKEGQIKTKKIVKRFKEMVKENTTSMPNFKSIKNNGKTKDKEIIQAEYEGNTAKILLDEKIYNICKENQEGVINMLKEETFEIRGWIFDRIVEYIQMEILKERLRPYFDEFELTKTNVVDDTKTQIDFILFYKEKEVFYHCYIDATTALDENVIQSKNIKAEKETIPYDFFIERTLEGCKDSKKHTEIQAIKGKKVIDESEQYTTPYIISNILKRIENGEEYEDYIHNFFKEKIGTITNLSTYLRPKEKHRANDIIQQAKKIDIEKIKRLSTVA